jgi:hypothetical protein
MREAHLLHTKGFEKGMRVWTSVERFGQTAKGLSEDERTGGD